MTDPATHYRVLARKYRPQNFAEVIGQEALVRTLSNAIQTGRIAHAFILTGVRGVGKTTTARIIARALNCIGPDGVGGPTVSPCGVCPNCRAIADDHYVEVLEMDAASHTGVDDIRELTEGLLHNRPVLGRYKVFIIDEVHMLSKSAFNALLKTLEEPPPHVIFVFATTEVQKVPVTVLSRCQRFSLRRVPVELLSAHYQRIAQAEGIEIEPAALGLIARAADGSVRDGLSLLDQAIALADGTVGETLVRDMLGIADRGLVCDLFATVLRGDAAGALGQMNALYQGGADPLMVLQDLLDFCHFVTRLKLVPGAGADDPMEAGDRVRGLPLAEKLAMPVLARAWQMLLKGIDEVQSAPSPEQAAEMVLVRLAYAADLPVPADLIRSLDGGEPVATRTVSPLPTPAPRPAPTMPPPMSSSTGPVATAMAAPVMAPPEPSPAPTAGPALDPMPQDFAGVIALFDEHREALTRAQLWSQLHLVSFEPGRIEFRPEEGAPRDLASRLSQCLSEWTGTRWVVAVSQEEGAPTLKQQEEHRDSALKGEVAMDPLVRAALEAFPGATIAAVRERLTGAEPGIEAEVEAPDDEATSTEE